jgi:hypothetical protein
MIGPFQIYAVVTKDGDIVALGKTLDAAWARAVSERGLEKQVMLARGFKWVVGTFKIDAGQGAT